MRPYVICHMCTTLDGKIPGHRWGKLSGYKHESDLFETTAASFGIAAWLVGTTTVPVADGGVAVSSLFDIPGKAPKRATATLRRLSHRTLRGGVIWARYRVIGKHRGYNRG